MFIKITSEIVDIAEGKIDGQDPEKAIELLRYLDFTVKLGKHFVFAVFDVLERLKKFKLPCIDVVFAAYSECGHIANHFSWHVEFVKTDEPSSVDKDHKVIKLSLDIFPGFEIYNETHLLCENINDTELYGYILKWYKIRHGLNIPSDYYPICGGGCTIGKVYKNEICLRRAFVLCITDSDYQFENTIDARSGNGNSMLGGTAKSVLSAEKEVPPIAGISYHLNNVSELENLIPFKFYCMVAADHHDPNIEDISILGNKNPEYLRYYDYKNGVSLRRLLDVHQDDPIISIVKVLKPDIESVVKKDKEDLDNKFPHLVDEIGEKLNSECRKECSKKIKYLRGLGENIMDRTLVYLKKEGKEKELFNLFDSAPRSLVAEYEVLGSLLFDWTCSMPKTRI